MDLKPLQPEKQKSPNDITDDGISMVVKLLQHEKHFFPNLLTDEGIVTEVKP